MRFLILHGRNKQKRGSLGLRNGETGTITFGIAEADFDIRRTAKLIDNFRESVADFLVKFPTSKRYAFDV